VVGNIFAKFSTLSQSVLLLWKEVHGTNTWPFLKLKTRPRFHPSSLSLSMKEETAVCVGGGGSEGGAGSIKLLLP
jgi:hypothetical protein